MKDADLEEYNGQNSPDGWPTSSDLSLTWLEKDLKTPTQDWSDPLSELDDFTYAWDDPPGSITTWDELSTNLLKPGNGKQNINLSLGEGFVHSRTT